MSEHKKPKLPPPFALSPSPRELPAMTSDSHTATVSEVASSPKRQKHEIAAAAAVNSTNAMPLQDAEVAAVPTAVSKAIAVAHKSIHDYRSSLNDHYSDMSNLHEETGSEKAPGQYMNGTDDIDMTSTNEPGERNVGESASENMVVDTLSTYLTQDVIIKMMNFCSISDLVQGIGMVNRYYQKLSYLDTAGWDTFYTKNILQQKCLIRVPPIPPDKDSSNKRTMYQYAVMDSNRQYITTEELCYDISGTFWRFRFKSAAGTDWISADPWHQGEPCRKMLFYQNGTVMLAYARPKGEATPSNVSPSITPSLPSNIDPATNVQQSHFLSSPISKIGDDQELVVTAPPLQMTWRFLTRPMDLPTRPIGGYIRIHVGNRDVPTYTCIRSPTNNWGFIFESCWGVYANFELPPKRSIATAHDANVRDAAHVAAVAAHTAALPAATTSNAPQQRGESENISSLIVDEDTTAPNQSDRDAEQQQRQEPLNAADMQDETLLVTNEVQWREAFLYNVGARILPEGDEAANEFDRFWQSNGNLDNINNAGDNENV